MEALSSSPLSFRLRRDLVAFSSTSSQRNSYNPLLTLNSSNASAISSSCSSCFGMPVTYIPVSFKCSRSRKKRRVLPISAVFERFTERAIKVVIFSQREARALGKDVVFTQHLLLGLIAEDRDPNGFLGSGIAIDEGRDVVRDLWNSDADAEGASASASSSTSSTDVAFSAGTKRVFEAAVEYSRTMGHNFIAPEHIAIGLCTVDDGSASPVIEGLGANLDRLADAAMARLQGELAKEGRKPATVAKGGQKKYSFNIDGTSGSSDKEKSALSQFCVDLTARASEGHIDPVIGRETEIERVIQILCRRTKNNPILLGESGVGKTAIAEGLAVRIAKNKRVMSLDMGLLIAGASERGELEARVTTLIKEIVKEGNVIIFIDEVHTIVGTGTVGKGNKGFY